MKKTTIQVIGAEGSKTTVAVPSKFKDVTPNSSVLAQYVRVFLKNQRQGTASTKDRSQIVGTTKKMYKQKGTGNARHASAKAPIFVGGGVAGGPKPRDYFVKMNKKQKVQAMESALVTRMENESLWVMAEDASSKIKKTKDFVTLLKSKEVKTGTKFTLVVDSEDNNLFLAARNITGANVVNAENVNPYEILKGKMIIFSQRAFSKLSKKS